MSGTTPTNLDEALKLIADTEAARKNLESENEHLRNIAAKGGGAYTLTDPADVPMQWRAANEEPLKDARSKFAEQMANRKVPQEMANGLWQDALLARYQESEHSAQAEEQNYLAEVAQWFGPGDAGLALFEKAANTIVEKADDDDVKAFVKWGLLDDGEAKNVLLERMSPTMAAALAARLGGTGGKPAPAPAPTTQPPTAQPPAPGNNPPVPPAGTPGVFTIKHAGQDIVIDSTTPEGRKKAINETLALRDSNTGQVVRDMPHFAEAYRAVIAAEKAAMGR